MASNSASLKRKSPKPSHDSWKLNAVQDESADEMAGPSTKRVRSGSSAPSTALRGTSDHRANQTVSARSGPKPLSVAVPSHQHGSAAKQTSRTVLRNHNDDDDEDDEDGDGDAREEDDDEDDDSDAAPDELTSTGGAAAAAVNSGDAVKRKRKRKKDAPQEISSKQPTPRNLLKPTLPAGAPKAFKPRDPRFDDMCGDFKGHVFRQNYRFLDEHRQTEMTQLNQALRKAKDESERIKYQRVLDKYKQEQHSRKQEERKRALTTAWRQQEAKGIEQGKKPFFLKKGAQKTLELADQYLQLKQSGKLQNFMAKRRKKNAQKDRRWIPEARP